MRILITGTPGCGKTTLAKKMGKKLGFRVINEKDFALQNNIGYFNEENELELPLKELKKKVTLFLKKNENVVFEGHVLCEIKAPFDKIILLKINPEELEMRLEKRNYSLQKIMDNVFCEGIDYCKKCAYRNYSPLKIIEVISQTTANKTFELAFQKIHKKQKGLAPKNNKKKA